MSIRRIAVIMFVISCALPAIARGGELLDVVTVGSGLAGRVEVRGDEPMTYLVTKRGETTWQIDIAKMSPGSLPSQIPLTLPAATGITIDKRSLGTIDVTRLTFAVRPRVEITVTPSDDRRRFSVSFSSGGTPTAADASLLDDLDDTRGKGGDSADYAAAPATPPVVPPTPGTPDLSSGTNDPEPPSERKGEEKPAAPDRHASPSDLDRELSRMETKESAPPSPTPPPLQPALSPPSVPPAVTAAPAVSPSVDQGALTPDELDVTPPSASPVPKPLPAISPVTSRPDGGGGHGAGATVTGSTIEMSIPGLASYRAFSLFQPTRVVLDLHGVSTDLSRTLSFDRLPAMVRGIRFSRYPDKTRVVFDMTRDDFPEYVVAREGDLLRITFRE